MRTKGWVVLAALAAGVAAFAGAAPAAELKMMTGPQGGSWYPLGGAVAEIAKRELKDVNVTVQLGAGISNVKGIEAGKADLGLGNSVSTADAVLGRKPFDKKTQNVRHVATLYLQYFHPVVLDKGADTIRTPAQLKGKRVTTQAVGNTGEQMARHFIATAGLTYKDLAKVSHGSYNDSVALMRDGHADAFMLVTTIPAPSLMDLATGRKIALMNLDDATFQKLLKLNAGYARRNVPAGTYKGQDKEVSAFGTYTHLIASGKLPNELVYQLTKAMAKNLASIQAVVPATKGLTPKEMAADVGVPLHPGAARYYKEIGAQN